VVLTHVVATLAQETQPGIGLDIKVNSGEHIQGEAFNRSKNHINLILHTTNHDTRCMYIYTYILCKCVLLLLELYSVTADLKLS